jgi:hypothetical protein
MFGIVQIRELFLRSEANFFAPVAQFRCVELAQLLSGGSEWDPRSFGQKSPARTKLFWLAVEACVAL